MLRDYFKISREDDLHDDRKGDGETLSLVKTGGTVYKKKKKKDGYLLLIIMFLQDCNKPRAPYFNNTFMNSERNVP